MSPRRAGSSSGGCSVARGGTALGRRDAARQRVLERLVGEVLLRLLAEQERDEPLRLLGLAGGREDARRGGDDEPPDVARLEAVVARRQARVLLEEAVVVVVVDQAHVDLAAADGLDDRVVVGVGAGVVVGHAAQPRGGRLLALDVAHGRHEVLERAVGGRDADPAAVALAGEVEDRPRQLGLRDRVGVVDQHPLPAAHAGPEPLRVLEVGVDKVEHRPRQRRQEVPVGEVGGGARALPPEDVGRGAVALLGEQQGELGRVAVADVDRDALLLGEPLQQGADQVLGAPGVDRERLAVRSAAARRQADGHDRRHRRHRRHRTPHSVPLRRCPGGPECKVNRR